MSTFLAIIASLVILITLAPIWICVLVVGVILAIIVLLVVGEIIMKGGWLVLKLLLALIILVTIFIGFTILVASLFYLLKFFN